MNLFAFLRRCWDAYWDMGRSKRALAELLAHHERLSEQYQQLKIHFEALDLTLRTAPQQQTFTSILERIRKRGTSVATVVDVGASDGQWSRLVMTVLPQANYLLFECDQRFSVELAHFCAEHGRVRVVRAAASDSRAPVFLSQGARESGKVAREDKKSQWQSVPAATIDDQVQELALPGPYFLKLDVHGYERPVLQGASRTLQKTDLLLVEMYNFTLGGGDEVRFPALCQTLDQLGFRPLHLCNLLNRPMDDALFQFDILFARKEAPEFQFEGWR